MNREQRARAAMFPEGASVMARVENGIDAPHVPAVVVTVGWFAGTYRVRAGRRLYWVSLTQVRKADA